MDPTNVTWFVSSHICFLSYSFSQLDFLNAELFEGLGMLLRTRALALPGFDPGTKIQKEVLEEIVSVFN